MAALTAERMTKRREGSELSLPVAASVTIYQGAIVCLNASDLAVPGSASTTLKAVGRAKETVVGGGTAGANRVAVEPGVFLYANSASGDAIALRDVGNHCWIVDDQTVAKTDGSSARSIAGRIVDVSAEGVWVDIGRRGLN